MIRTILASLTFVAFALHDVSAAELELVSPQGTVKEIRQLTARFSDQMVSFGDPRIVEPFTISCDEKGMGRWVDGRNWGYDFGRNLPAGIACSFELKADLKTIDGHPISGQSKFQFDTGGPEVKVILPQGGRIDENQVFLIKPGAADKQTILDNARCEVDGIPERIPVKVLEGKERQKILGQQKKWLDRYVEYIAEVGLTDSQKQEKRAAANSDQVLMLQCQRSLPNGRKVALIWGKGISTPKGIATVHDQAISYFVRNSFTAKFSCDRVNAQSSCIPVLPMRLNFTAQISSNQDFVEIR